MFSLKLWLGPFILLIVGGLMLTLGSSLLYEQLIPPSELIVDAERIGVSGFLQTDSERSISAAAIPTADPAVRAFVKTGPAPASENAPADAGLAALKETLLSVDSTRLGRPDFAVLLDKSGRVILESGAPSGLPPDAQGIPWVRDGLTGQKGDALHRDAAGKPFHLAMAPILDNNVPVGVIGLAWALDMRFVARAETGLGGDVLLFDKDTIFRGKSKLDDVLLQEIRKSGSGGAVESEIPVPQLPILVPDANRYIGRTLNLYSGDNSLQMLVLADRNVALRSLIWAQTGTVAVTLLLFLLLVVLVLSVQKSIRRPMDVITDHLSQYAQGAQTGIIPEASLSGPFVRLAKQINMILQAPTPGSAPRPGTAPISSHSSASLSSPSMASLSSGTLATPSNPSMPSLPIPPPPDDDSNLDFGAIPGFGDAPPSAPSSMPPTPATMPPVPVTASQIAPVSQAPVSEELASSALAGLFDDGGADPLAAFRVEAQPQRAAPPPPTPPPPPAESYNPEATVMFQVPEELIQESAQPSFPPQAPYPSQPQEDRTVVAQIPQELLSRAAPKHDLAEQEQSHYNEVFRDFIRTREECGEDTSDLTFDRFVAKLMKNRQAIMEKYKCKSVRFQVYVKGDKAALRAVPVRD